MTPNPWELLNDILENGTKGFSRMRGRELVKMFDRYYAHLRDGESPLPMLHKITALPTYERSTYFNVGGWIPVGKNEKHVEQLRTDLLLESDSLMSRLMELAFDLDIDE